MKKSLLALSAAAVALSASAVAPKQVAPVSLLTPQRTAELKSDIPNMRPVSASPKLMKAPAKAPSSADVIYEANGTVQDVAVTGTGYYNFWGYLMPYQDEVSGTHVVYGDNDEVYFYNILPNAATNTYVKGVKTGDKVELSLPQTAMFYDAEGYGLQLTLLKYVEEEQEDGSLDWWYYATEGDKVTFSVADDGTMVCDDINDNLMLGFTWTDDDTWAGYGALALSMTPFNEKPVTLPDDLGVSENFWQINHDGYAQFVNWAQGYDEVYFQGLFQYMPDAWVKGSMTYDEDGLANIAITQDQYMGTYNGFFIYVKFATLEFDEEGNVVDGEFMPVDYRYQLVWDYEEMKMTPKDKDVYVLLNADPDRIYYLEYADGITLVHQDEFSGTPLNPFGLSFDESTYESYEYGSFFFEVPAESTEGDMLLPEYLSYVVYVDGEEWEFDAEEYQISESLVEIPWNFSAYYIYNYGATRREVDFFVEGITTLGVQSIYSYGGEETRSEIVSIDLDEGSAVAGLEAGKKVASVKFYGLDGREVADPAAGIFVKRVTFEDGSVATFKKAVR